MPNLLIEISALEKIGGGIVLLVMGIYGLYHVFKGSGPALRRAREHDAKKKEEKGEQ